MAAWPISNAQGKYDAMKKWIEKLVKALFGKAGVFVMKIPVSGMSLVYMRKAAWRRSITPNV